MSNDKKRPGWNKYFMDIAELVSTRATCTRRKVGAVIVKDNRILSTGYNGAPSGFPHCGSLMGNGCLREEMNVPSGERHELCRGIHAEQNAIIQAALHGVSILGSHLICTHSPCCICSKMIVNAGIDIVVYKYGYPDKQSDEIFKFSDIHLVNIEDYY